jgi:DNA polymerase-1
MFEDGAYRPHVVLSEDQLAEVVDAYHDVDYFTFDCETVPGRAKRFDKDKPALDERTNKVVWLSLAGHGRCDVIPMGHPTITDKKTGTVHEAPAQLRRSEVLRALKPVFFGPARKVNQHVGFDLLTLGKYWGEVPPGPVADIQTLCHLYQSTMRRGGFKLDNLSKHYLGFEYQKLAREGAIDTFPFWAVAQYVGLDALVANLLWVLLRPRIAAREKAEKLFQLEQELTEVVIDMKLHGITVDQPGLRALGDDLALQIKEADDAVRSHVPVGWQSPNKNPFNPNSTDHLAKLLYTDLGLPVMKTTGTGQPSTDKFTLDALSVSHPVVRDLQQLRGLTKLKSTYVDGVLDQMDDDGRLRAGFKQCGTETGRFSCSEPNLQNLPSANDMSADEGKKIRHMFMAAPGCVLIGADYSQIEGRVMGDLCARYGAGTALRDVFLEPNVDWHRATAARMYRIPPEKVDSKQRAKGKTANFALLYGGYWTLLVRKFKMTEKEAKETYKRFHEAYPELDAFVDITCTQARRRRRPYTETLWGRRRYFPDLNLPVYGEGDARKARYLKVQAAEREAVNHRVQGTSADITKSAMVRYRRRAERLGRRAEWPLLITEHDALLIEAPERDSDEAAKVLLEAMQGVKIDLSVSIPVDVHIGLRWSEAK